MAAFEHSRNIALTFLFNLQQIFVWRSPVKVLIVWLVFVTGSFFHDFYPLPSCYLSHKRNVLNVYFVKKGWGWTCAMLTFYVAATLMIKKVNNVKAIAKNVLRLFYLTAVWYFSTSTFEYIENLTGHCEGEVSVMTKASCIKQRSHWLGFDISGHCFLLSYCILILNEELLSFVSLKENIIKMQNASEEMRTNVSVLRINIHTFYYYLVDSISVAMTFLMILWEFMLVLTCLYYHTVYQKVLGTIFGILAWHLIYNITCKINHPLAPDRPVNFT